MKRGSGAFADIFPVLGGIAISPDESEVAYIYADRLYRSSFATPVAPSTAPRAHSD